MIVDELVGCARCEGSHKDLLFQKFTHPISDSDGTLWTHFAMCPATNEPILMRQEDSEFLENQ